MGVVRARSYGELELNFMGPGKQKGISRGKGMFGNEGKGGNPTHKPPVRKTCGPMMVPTSAARRSRGCAVQTDVDVGTRKGERFQK